MPKGWSSYHSSFKNLLRPNDIYKSMTLLPKDYYLVPDNGAKNLLRPNDTCKSMTLLPKDYYLVPSNDAKNLLRPFFICMKKMELFFLFKMTHLNFVCVVSITASAQVVQVIKWIFKFQRKDDKSKS